MTVGFDDDDLYIYIFCMCARAKDDLKLGRSRMENNKLVIHLLYLRLIGYIQTREP